MDGRFCDEIELHTLLRRELSCGCSSGSISSDVRFAPTRGSVVVDDGPASSLLLISASGILSCITLVTWAQLEGARDA